MKPKPVFEKGERVTLTIGENEMYVIETCLKKIDNGPMVRTLDKATIVRFVLGYLHQLSEFAD